MEWRWNARAGEMGGLLEKTSKPAASSGGITTYENPRATTLGIEPSSPGWEASSLSKTSCRRGARRSGRWVEACAMCCKSRAQRRREYSKAMTRLPQVVLGDPASKPRRKFAVTPTPHPVGVACFTAAFILNALVLDCFRGVAQTGRKSAGTCCRDTGRQALTMLSHVRLSPHRPVNYYMIPRSLRVSFGINRYCRMGGQSCLGASRHLESSPPRVMRRGGLRLQPASPEHSCVVTKRIGNYSRREEVCDASKSRRCRHSRDSQKGRNRRTRVRSSAGMQGRGKPEIPEKPRLPAASSGTIPICDNPDVTWPEIEPAPGYGKCSTIRDSWQHYFADTRWQAQGRRQAQMKIKGSEQKLKKGGRQHDLHTKETGDPRPGHRIFASGNRAGRCRWSAGFLGYIPFPPPLPSGTAPYSLQSPIIGSQDLAVKSRPNLFTHSLSDRRPTLMTAMTVYPCLERTWTGTSCSYGHLRRTASKTVRRRLLHSHNSLDGRLILNYGWEQTASSTGRALHDARLKWARPGTSGRASGVFRCPVSPAVVFLGCDLHRRVPGQPQSIDKHNQTSACGSFSSRTSYTEAKFCGGRLSVTPCQQEVLETDLVSSYCILTELPYCQINEREQDLAGAETAEFISHSVHVWAHENPHATRPHTYQERFSDQCGGQYDAQLFDWTGEILPRRLNKRTYSIFLQQTLPELLANHDDAPAHFSADVRTHLVATYPHRWIGRGGPVPWPPRSPDLSCLDLFLWGHLESSKYDTPIHSEQDLVDGLAAAGEVRDIPGILEHARPSDGGNVSPCDLLHSPHSSGWEPAIKIVAPYTVCSVRVAWISNEAVLREYEYDKNWFSLPWRIWAPRLQLTLNGARNGRKHVLRSLLRPSWPTPSSSGPVRPHSVCLCPQRLRGGIYVDGRGN
ncbi:hypothetical protein PR048_003373 [Dryococelus australis]|uniref:Uncharacterized protein n=1 Tax=Dryococelus australis TaxID=614101 RepID=A0ABQ9IPX1_9NEOP|nr:hypothetical protein PR048_003373 [Dryococelus australis]